MVINSQETMNELRNLFNLNLYEVKIWIALLSKSVSTAGELSDIANVPRSRAYDVLESLEKKGFVVMKLSKPIKYLAVKPVDVITNYKNSILNNAKGKANKLEDAKKSPLIRELNLLHLNGVKNIEPHNISALIKGRANIYNQIGSLIKNASKEIIISTSANGFLRQLKSFKDQLISARKRGVDIRFVAPINTDVKSLIKEISEDFGTHKILNNSNSRFIVTDNKNILFLLMEDEKVHPKYDIGIWVKSSSFAGSINNMFNYMWEGLQ